MTLDDRLGFEQYLAQCSNDMIVCVLARERMAGHRDYAALAEIEASKRGLKVD